MGEMDLNIKQQVLVAIYVEYQKKLPDMKSVKADALGISTEQFYIALDKLDNEGLVNNIEIVRGSNGIPVIVKPDNANMSSYGIEYVEKKLSIKKSYLQKKRLKKL
jgi:hypothetical protein